MISMNRYICVAAVSVYVGHAMDGDVQTQEHTQYEQIQKISKAYPPSTTDLKSVQYATYMEYCARTFGTGKRGDAGLFFKKLHGSGFGLSPDEQGVTTSAVALASAYLEQRDLKTSNLDLYSACDHIMKTKKIPSEWESSHGKRFNGVINGVKKFFTGGSSFVQRFSRKSHCRLTGDSVDADKVSDSKTGIKLSSRPRNGFSLSVQDSVALVFTSAGFSSARDVFNIMKDTEPHRPDDGERRTLLTNLLKVDIHCESPVARTLMVQEFQALTDSRPEDYPQDFLDLISTTPFFHVLSSTPKFQGKINQRFRNLPVEKTIVEKWPVSIIVRENEVDVNDEAQRRFKNAKPTGKVQKAALAKLSSLFKTIDHRSFNVFEVVQVPVPVPEAGLSAGKTEPTVTIEFTHTTILMAQHLDAPKSLLGSYDIYSSHKKPFFFGADRYYGKYDSEVRPSSFMQPLMQRSRGRLSALKSKLQEAQEYYKFGEKFRKWSMEIAIIIMAGLLTGGWGSAVAFLILLFNRLWQMHQKRDIEKCQKEIRDKEYEQLLAEVSGRRADGSSRRRAETPAATDLMQLDDESGSGLAGAPLDGVEAHAAAARTLPLGGSHDGSGRSQSAELHVPTTSARGNTNPARASTGDSVLASHADGSDGGVNAQQRGHMLDRSRALGGGQGGAAAATRSSQATPADVSRELGALRTLQQREQQRIDTQLRQLTSQMGQNSGDVARLTAISRQYTSLLAEREERNREYGQAEARLLAAIQMPGHF